MLSMFNRDNWGESQEKEQDITIFDMQYYVDLLGLVRQDIYDYLYRSLPQRGDLLPADTICGNLYLFVLELIIPSLLRQMRHQQLEEELNLAQFGIKMGG